ncbi:IS66 family insertion sequence element accessory protein TnpB [Pseudomonas gessardii]|nr:IS66 family insertion sequence element accessory protein TnpB [Pseudomonas gessardii]
MDTCLSRSSGTGFTRFRSVEAGARHPTRSANVCHHRSPFWPADAHSKVAILKSRRVRPIHPWAHSMIRIDSIWLATEPMDMRAGTETALARVIAVFGAAKPHCAYLFANRRGNRMKVLVHDGLGIWLAARRLNQGKFHWPGIRQGLELELNTEQLQALVLGLPWQRMGSGGAITLL